MPRSTADFVEHHAVRPVGYSDHTRLIKFMNNWGVGWGDQGFGYLPYEYFDRYLTDAWFHWPDKTASWLPTGTTMPFAHGLKMFTNPLNNAAAVIDIWNITEDIRIGWAMMTYRGKELEIEDFFVRREWWDSAQQRKLTQLVLEFAEEQEYSIRLWVPHSDLSYRAANFPTINDFIRKAGLVVRPRVRTHNQ